MSGGKHIAVVCNYRLNPDRIGGMDRFFKAYNEHLLRKEFKLNWFFTGNESFEFYKDFDLQLSENQTVESLMLNEIDAGKKFDVVVTHFLTLCTPFYKQLKKSVNPYILAVDHNPRPLNGFPIRKRIKNKLKGKLYSKYIDRFIGVSEYTVDQIIKDYGKHLKKKTRVVYNGIDTSRYLKRGEPNLGKFIVASHLRHSKGIQDLIAAVALLPEEIRNKIRIDIFGEGPKEENLKEQIKINNLQSQFNFKGSTPDLPERFHEYSYMLQPTYMECFSLSILESMAANVPVLTTPVGGNPEIVEHGVNGFIFEAGDVRSFASLLEKATTGELTVEKEINKKIEQEFTLEKMLQDHLNLLPCI